MDDIITNDYKNSYIDILLHFLLVENFKEKPSQMRKIRKNPWKSINKHIQNEKNLVHFNYFNYIGNLTLVKMMQVQ